jgi:hypothetical protein
MSRGVRSPRDSRSTSPTAVKSPGECRCSPVAKTKKVDGHVVWASQGSDASISVSLVAGVDTYEAARASMKAFSVESSRSRRRNRPTRNRRVRKSHASLFDGKRPIRRPALPQLMRRRTFSFRALILREIEACPVRVAPYGVRSCNLWGPSCSLWDPPQK